MVVEFFIGLFILFLFISCGVAANAGNGTFYGNRLLEFMRYTGYTIMIIFCIGCIGVGIYITSAIGMLFLKIFNLVP